MATAIFTQVGMNLVALSSEPYTPRARVTAKVNGGPEINKSQSRSRRPEPVEQHRAGRNHPSPRQLLRHPRAKRAGEKARRSPRCCFGATPLVGELPRSNGQTTAWPSAPARAKGDS